jgi:hypothetical protein
VEQLASDKARNTDLGPRMQAEYGLAWAWRQGANAFPFMHARRGTKPTSKCSTR